MNRHLLDVNVLLALVWPRHESHDAAHSWFAKSGHKAWATSPLTQLGVLRLLTNPAVTQGAVSAASALEAVNEATRHEGHEFWPLDREMTIGLRQPWRRACKGIGSGRMPFSSGKPRSAAACW